MPVPVAPACDDLGDRVEVLDSTDADVQLLVTHEGRVLAASRSVTTRLGWDLDRVVRQGVWAEVVEPSQREALLLLVRQTVATGSARMTLQVPAREGTLTVDAAAVLLVDRPGTPVLVTARDITHDQLAAAELAASEHQWRVAFEHSPLGGALVGLTGEVLVVNDALCEMTGWRAHELTRMDMADVVVAPDVSPFALWWHELLVAGAGEVDRVMRTAGGRSFWARISGATVLSSDAPTRVVLQIEDITRRRAAELELAERALNDDLTGAPNRFLTRQWLASALDDTPDSAVGVLYCDVDRFKVVNDSLGHPAGDDLIVQVANRLRLPLRPEDLVGRVGGDEFVIVAEGVRTMAELHELADRLCAAMSEPFDLGGHRHAVTLSLGGTVGRSLDTADEVLMRADMALLRAKRLGRARFVAFDPAEDRIATKADLQLEDELCSSLEAGQLRAYYQPIVTLEDLEVVGYEALVRWDHPRQGLLSPADFLELAETSGYISPLGWWMLDQACSDAAAGHVDLHRDDDATGLLRGRWVAVNASAGQLTRPGVAAQVHRALERSGLPPSRLHLEITETALITATTSLAGELRELADAGVAIALDDFGTGYSSLSLLRQFPVDIVKIDRSFISPLTSDRSAHAIVKAVLSMCADLGMSTVAEGIETEQQRDLLRALGCSHGQGYLFGHAEPVATRQPVVHRNQLPAQPRHPEPARWGTALLTAREPA